MLFEVVVSANVSFHDFSTENKSDYIETYVVNKQQVYIDPRVQVNYTGAGSLIEISRMNYNIRKKCEEAIVTYQMDKFYGSISIITHKIPEAFVWTHNFANYQVSSNYIETIVKESHKNINPCVFTHLATYETIVNDGRLQGLFTSVYADCYLQILDYAQLLFVGHVSDVKLQNDVTLKFKVPFSHKCALLKLPQYTLLSKSSDRISIENNIVYYHATVNQGSDELVVQFTNGAKLTCIFEIIPNLAIYYL